MNEEDKIHINSFKFYDRDELEELTKEYYLENKKLKEQYCERTDCSGRLGNSKKYYQLQQENKLLQEQLQQKEDIINKAKEYIINNSLYEEEYDYDYEENIYLSGIHDDDVRRILVEILDNKGE